MSDILEIEVGLYAIGLDGMQAFDAHRSHRQQPLQHAFVLADVWICSRSVIILTKWIDRLDVCDLSRW